MVHEGGKNHPPALLQIATETTAWTYSDWYMLGGIIIATAVPTLQWQLHSSVYCHTPTIIKVRAGIHADIMELNRIC